MSKAFYLLETKIEVESEFEKQMKNHSRKPSVNHLEKLGFPGKEKDNSQNCKLPFPLEMPRTGIEPARISPHAPQTCASTNSATWANLKFQI